VAVDQYVNTAPRLPTFRISRRGSRNTIWWDSERVYKQANDIIVIFQAIPLKKIAVPEYRLQIERRLRTRF
jgi:hypothetical protein